MYSASTTCSGSCSETCTQFRPWLPSTRTRLLKGTTWLACTGDLSTKMCSRVAFRVTVWAKLSPFSTRKLRHYRGQKHRWSQSRQLSNSWKKNRRIRGSEPSIYSTSWDVSRAVSAMNVFSRSGRGASWRTASTCSRNLDCCKTQKIERLWIASW